MYLIYQDENKEFRYYKDKNKKRFDSFAEKREADSIIIEKNGEDIGKDDLNPEDIGDYNRFRNDIRRYLS